MFQLVVVSGVTSVIRAGPTKVGSGVLRWSQRCLKEVDAIASGTRLEDRTKAVEI
jgi:hypothetical protein